MAGFGRIKLILACFGDGVMLMNAGVGWVWGADL